MYTDQRLADYFEQTASTGTFSGVILSAHRGEIRYLRAFGLANREHGVPNTTETRFLIASISKPITALAVMLLEEQGRLRVTDTARTYLPEIAELDERITIHHLLTHTSGLSDFEGLPGYFETSGKLSFVNEAIFGLIAGELPDFLPGEGWSYCNTGYNALGLIIDRTAGMPYEQFVHSRLLEPLGMADTGFAESERIIPRLAGAYTEKAQEIVKAPFLAAENFRASGSMYSTAEDLLKLDRVFTGGHHAITREDTIKRMLTQHAFAQTRYYGYGLSLYEHSYGHGGSLPGCRCIYRHYPAQDRTFIFLSNCDFGGTDDLLRGAETILYA
ncbi:serine hydrolase domain-containing protein [Paenibacillus thalictri]|uniref:Class A beta-lactamase-related serine hydrolase n=1 Tax=Paenibacillus thalictri TaxID=2527873 RepID=A0A4Q9DV24_9BACL|nr:serine hydrolase domain-containing protein [Paenibacillus thalictri]TBL79438.1 class A beta-lactamase-related serine hydrolase [Paenibacillus thalictri]